MQKADVSALMQDCTQCGLCREVCIVERLGAHSITSFLCGEDEYSSWLCASCWRCQEICPQGVDIHTIMMEKRREQKPPEGHRANFARVLQSGYALVVDERVNELRRVYGLEPVEFVPLEWVDVLLGTREEQER